MAEIKSPEEVLKDVYEHHKNNVLPDENWASWEQCKKDGTIYMVVSAMEAYHAQFTHAGKGVDELIDKYKKEADSEMKLFVDSTEQEREGDAGGQYSLLHMVYSMFIKDLKSLAGASFNQAQCGCGLRWVKASVRLPVKFKDTIVRNIRTGKVWEDRNMGHFERWGVGIGEDIKYAETEWLDESSPCPCERYREALTKIIGCANDEDFASLRDYINQLATDALTQQ